MASVSIWLNRFKEDSIRELGFTIPKFPETGDVIFKNEKVGYMDNFTGLTIIDHESEAYKVLKTNENKLNLAIWDGGIDV